MNLDDVRTATCGLLARRADLPTFMDDDGVRAVFAPMLDMVGFENGYVPMTRPVDFAWHQHASLDHERNWENE